MDLPQKNDNYTRNLSTKVNDATSLNAFGFTLQFTFLYEDKRQCLVKLKKWIFRTSHQCDTKELLMQAMVPN